MANIFWTVQGFLVSFTNTVWILGAHGQTIRKLRYVLTLIWSPFLVPVCMKISPYVLSNWLCSGIFQGKIGNDKDFQDKQTFFPHELIFCVLSWQQMLKRFCHKICTLELISHHDPQWCVPFLCLENWIRLLLK